MSRRVTVVTIALTAVVAFLVGAIAAGGVARSRVLAGPTTTPDLHTVSRTTAPPPAALVPTFADIEIDGEGRTAIRLSVHDRQRGAAAPRAGEPRLSAEPLA